MSSPLDQCANNDRKENPTCGWDEALCHNRVVQPPPSRADWSKRFHHVCRWKKFGKVSITGDYHFNRPNESCKKYHWLIYLLIGITSHRYVINMYEIFTRRESLQNRYTQDDKYCVNQFIQYQCYHPTYEKNGVISCIILFAFYLLYIITKRRSGHGWKVNYCTREKPRTVDFHAVHATNKSKADAGFNQGVDGLRKKAARHLVHHCDTGGVISVLQTFLPVFHPEYGDRIG